MAGLNEQEEFELLSLEREKAMAKRAPLIGGGSSLKDSLLSLIAPGGIWRMTSGAMESFDKAAYDAGGKVTDIAAEAGATPKVAAGIGTAANVAIQSLPMLGGGEAAKVTTPAFKAGGRRLMQSAIKPLATDLEKGRVPAAIQTMLEKGYNPTEGGVAAMRSQVGQYMDDVKTLLAPSTERVSILDAMKKLNELKAKFGAGTLGKQKIAEIDSVMKELRSHPSVLGGRSMSIQDAQAMKQANYKDLGSAAYGLGLKPAAERDAIKTITASLKAEIEKGEPSVAILNQKASELLNAIKVTQRRALIEGNKNPASLGVSIASAAHDPMAALGLWANSSAWAKSNLARALYSGSEIIPQTVGQLGGAAVGAQMGSPPSLQSILDDLQRRNNQQ